jgi:hypothetical protein
MLTMAYALLLAVPAADPEPAAVLKAPVVKYVGLKGGAMVFEVSNPNKQSVPYVGYTSDSFEGGLEKGTIAPLYQVELRQGKAWKAHNVGWCGTGVGPVKVPGKGKATFTVHAPGGEWGEVRVGLRWYTTADRKGAAATAWSGAVTRKAATPRKAP